jgi:hypothetical protein
MEYTARFFAQAHSMHCLYSLEQFYTILDHTWKVGGNLAFFLAILALFYLRDRVNTAEGHANITGQNTSRRFYNTSSLFW